MDAQDIIDRIANAKKITPVKVFLKEREEIDFSGTNVRIFGAPDRIIFGDWSEIQPVLMAHNDLIADVIIETTARNSAIPLLDLKDIPARIEPGAIIRDDVSIGKNAVIMMGAILNIGAVVGDGTMIDMGAVLGGRATVGKNCHVGAGAVLAGVIEPASAKPVVVDDGVLIGANAVVIEGVHIGEGAVVAAGAVVIEDVAPGKVVAGCPARVIKDKDENTSLKTALQESLRKI
ncbi:MAG: 2,3,4,5-tetrahydropyridine-2,6-dicarboxylate N-acetyltransferase [Synergistaceae bacterium]|nr:2,3,4,5-tetrahydropyridine-2,6-dicarboxylate N-acetyltransferase [Synergistaceae bacterium]